MKTDTFVKLLRKVVREEVQQVVREELGLLLETPEPKKTVIETKNSLVDSIKESLPAKPVTPTMFANNSILNDILNETAVNGDFRSMGSYDSSNAQTFGMGNPMMAEATSVVSSVDQMLSSARPAGDVSQVQIDAVPDFSGLMKTMKEKGQL
jgi:hypothetical protein